MRVFGRSKSVSPTEPHFIRLTRLRILPSLDRNREERDFNQLKFFLKDSRQPLLQNTANDILISFIFDISLQLAADLYDASRGEIRGNPIPEGCLMDMLMCSPFLLHSHLSPDVERYDEIFGGVRERIWRCLPYLFCVSHLSLADATERSGDKYDEVMNRDRTGTSSRYLVSTLANVIESRLAGEETPYWNFENGLPSPLLAGSLDGPDTLKLIKRIVKHCVDVDMAVDVAT